MVKCFILAVHKTCIELRFANQSGCVGFSRTACFVYGVPAPLLNPPYSVQAVIRISQCDGNDWGRCARLAVSSCSTGLGGRGHSDGFVLVYDAVHTVVSTFQEVYLPKVLLHHCLAHKTQCIWTLCACPLGQAVCSSIMHVRHLQSRDQQGRQTDGQTCLEALHAHAGK